MRVHQELGQLVDPVRIHRRPDSEVDGLCHYIAGEVERHGNQERQA
jgi:hypothetical protein